jgi:hypothetical protein
MTALETFNQLNADFEKTIAALLNVRTIKEIQAARQLPGYKYEPEKHMREYWIALGQYSVSANFSYLSYIVNATEHIVPAIMHTIEDIQEYCKQFSTNKEKVIAAFERIIGKPNQVFIGYAKPITMEEYLQNIVSNIHTEALNLDYNYQQLKLA